MNYIIDTNSKNLYVCSDHFVTDGDHQVRNNVAFDKADTPPLIDVETATEDTSNNFYEDVALIEDTLLISDSHPIPSLNDVTTRPETFDMTSTMMKLS
ncbi:hypothetical protein GHT06_004493 [Daphnia sinensis]|uniref:Uncharacterized protein n=1 Tax=Daphnia sinensis TaxID=1820382 RepID=A0AAD5PQ85_9CRUS|nr:hypothetical protein GHT06_004493 [Daphnia sinensis]